MFATYVYKPGATAANILSDVLALIADGAIASLSADAVQAACLKSGVASGWTLDDLAYGVVSAPFEDGEVRKAFQITQAANGLRMSGMDSWNAATHVGANVSTAQTMAALPLASGGSLGVIACPEVLAIWESSNWFLVGVEFPRVEPSFKGRAATMVLRWNNGTDFAGRLTRAKNPMAAGDLVNSAVSFIGSVPLNSGFRGESEVMAYQMVPIFPVLYAVGYTQVVGPSPRGVLSVPMLGAVGTIFADLDGAEYLMLPYRNPQTIAIGVLRK